MKAFLMYQAQDFDLQQPLPSNEQALTQDLELSTLFQAMARGDEFLFEVARRAVLCGTDDLDVIRYRQAILQDCLRNAAVVRSVYQIPIKAIISKKKQWRGIFSRSPGGILNEAIDLLEIYVTLLRELRQIADEHASGFRSEGFTRFFAMIQDELDDAFFVAAERHLKALHFRDGVLLSTTLGKGNQSDAYILRKPNDNDKSWKERILSKKPPVYSFRIPPRDEHGARAISDLKDQGINLVANALAQSAEHISSFLDMLRVELAFYVGCLNLSEQLAQLDEPMTIPTAVAVDERQHAFQGLYDLTLTLTMSGKVVGNDVEANHKDLVMITGANQGGKSTFLRSIGVAQLMMQCGMFVPAESFCANVCDGLFTHYRREEDATMKSGKLDEELSRMSSIVDSIRPNSLILFNESFAATNEREGSEIGRQIVSALLERQVKVFFVTHLYELAHGFFARGMDNALFLQAERQADGIRTFKVIEGEPSATSYGVDLYELVFDGVKEPG